jgi:branched-chain amino acid transport system ATP-binding protein
MLLQVEKISKNFGGVQALVDFSLSMEDPTIIGIIGPNGAGKTTLFNVISGVYPPDDGGKIYVDGQDISGKDQFLITRAGIARTFQNIRLFKGLSVLENVMCAFDPTSKYGILGGLLPTSKRIKEEKLGRQLSEHYLDLVELTKYRGEKPENLAYGLQRRLEIARALACKPKVLLLDEPAAGLNPREVSDLMGLIERLNEDLGIGILVIEHRLELVMGLSKQIYVLDFGHTIAVGSPCEIKSNPEVIRAYLGEEECER